jgi:hypothetical protein
MLRPYITVDQISYPTQITGALLPHRRCKQHRSLRRYAGADQGLTDRHERGQATRVVGDSRALEARAAPCHRNVEIGAEHGIEVGRENDATDGTAIDCIPSTDVSNLIHTNIGQSDVPKQLRDVRAARRFGPRRRGDRGQRGLTGERRFIGALDMRARRTDSIVG